MFLKITRALLFSFLFTPGLFSQSITETLVRGEKFYKEKNYRQALSQFKAAIDLNPNSNRAHLGFAKTSLALGSRSDSFTSYQKILESEPKNREAIAGLAEIYSLDGKQEEALRILEDSLKEEPYNPILLLGRATVLLRMGKSEAALRRLEEAKSKISSNYEYTILLAKVYSANRNYNRAAEILNQLLKEYPENPEVFSEKAGLHYQLASKSESLSEQENHMKQALELIETSLALDPKYDDARRLGVRILVWQGNFPLAYEFVKYLSEEYQSDTVLLHYHAFLSIELNKTEEIAPLYNKLLNENELNTIARFTIEEYALKNYSETDPLRKKLGQLRIQLYEKSKSDLDFKIAEYHLARANQLIPQNRKLRKIMTEVAYRRGDRNRLLQELLFQRKEEPDNIKVNNRIENLVGKIKESLGYKEGLKSNEGVLLENLRKVPEIFLFDLKSEEYLTDYPDTTQAVTTSLRFALSQKPQIQLIEGQENKEIRDSIELFKGKSNFTNGVYYSADVLELLNRNRKKDDLIRFFGYGTFKKNNQSLHVTYHIYDRANGKIIRTIKVNSFGKNMLEEVSTRLANEIIQTMPLQGNVVKINQDSIILNVGLLDGVRKGDELFLFKPNREPISIKILQADDTVAEAEVNSLSWKKDSGVGTPIGAGQNWKRKDYP